MAGASAAAFDEDQGPAMQFIEREPWKEQATREWRTYAYGGSAGTWRTVEGDAWAPIRDLGVERYRERLYRYYLCDPALGTLKRAEMLRRMRYGLPADDRFH